MSVESRTPEPGSNAGREGADEQHQQTEEEKMLDEIAKQKEMIDAMSGDDTFGEMMRRAPHQKKLGQLEFKFHISTEKKRLARALSKFEEVYGVLYSEPCLICLEDIHVHTALHVTKLFVCCGGFICMSCVRNLDRSGLGLDKCPLCRESLAGIAASERTETSMKFAKRGVSWAQREVGRSLVIGGEGCEEQEKAGLEWLNKAVAQNYPPATLELSGLHRIGLKSLGRKSQEKANELLMKAANLGYAEANSELAQYCLLAEDGFEKNNEEAYFRASVAFALDGANAQAAKILGVLHFNEDVAESSPYLACYYANMRQIKISRKARVASILTSIAQRFRN